METPSTEALDACPPAELGHPPGNQTWADALYELLVRHGIKIVSYVPDGGHRRLIERARHDPHIQDVLLTNEAEGVGLGAGADLGLGRAVLLMQSSGVGNCVNALGLIKTGAFPFLTLVSMRGEAEERNPWQRPMGQAVEAVFQSMGVTVVRVDGAEQVVPTVVSALHAVFDEGGRCAVLLTQRLLGVKQF